MKQFQSAHRFLPGLKHCFANLPPQSLVLFHSYTSVHACANADASKAPRIQNRGTNTQKKSSGTRATRYRMILYSMSFITEVFLCVRSPFLTQRCCSSEVKNLLHFKYLYGVLACSGSSLSFFHLLGMGLMAL